jgi:hypothetical protein
MIVFFDRKRFESALVKMPCPFGMMVSVPAHCVGISEPAKESRDLVLGLRPNHKVPVVRHHAVGKDWQPFPSKCLGYHPIERVIVLGFFKQRQPSHRSVENMKTGASRANARSSRHADRLPPHEVGNNEVRPLLSPFVAPGNNEVRPLLSLEGFPLTAYLSCVNRNSNDTRNRLLADDTR